MWEWDEKLEKFLYGDDEGQEVESDAESAPKSSDGDEDVENRLLRLQLIKSRAVDLKSRYQQHIEQNFDIVNDLQRKRKEVAEALDNLNKFGIAEKISKYYHHQNKIKLMTMGILLKRLESAEVEHIPDIVLSIQSAAPQTLLSGMHICTAIKQTAMAVRSTLLKQFLLSFEHHLNEDSSSSWIDGDKRTSMWTDFLKQTRSSLLAFALVNILPSALIETKFAVLEAFKNSIDEAFTPLWGRFYHHLKQGRGNESTQQLFWTFSFARTFIQMLLSLCEHVTSTAEMKRLCDVDYRRASIDQIVEKSTKFLRAHLAEILVAHDNAADDFAARIVDETLELDHWQHQFFPPLYLCGVLYEAKAWFHRFLWTEQRTIFEGIRESMVSSDVAYDDMFLPKGGSRSQWRDGAAVSCYVSVFRCLAAIHLARARYAYFPPQAQYILCEMILEPILCLGLGLLLYRIRSDPILFAISQGHAKKVGDDLLCCRQVESFGSCAEYFQSSLSKDDDSLPPLASSITRCKRRWAIVQSWMPKILITQTQCKLGFSLQDLGKTALKTSDKFQSISFDYRVHDLSGDKGSQPLAVCVQMIRGLAITLSDVLNQQLDLQ